MEIERAFKRLLISSPFYGLFCLSLPKVITRDVDTLGVARKGITCELAINPDFWEMHSDDEQIALLEHELSHIALQHMFLSQSFADKKRFNYAADYEVNSYIDNLPKAALRASDIGLKDGLGVKVYYEKLSGNQKQNTQPQQQQQSSSNPQGKDEKEQQQSQEDEEKENQNQRNEDSKPQEDKPDTQSEPQNEEEAPAPNSDGRNTIDNHSQWSTFNNLPEAAQQLIQNNINSIVKNVADQVEKSCGNIPGQFKELVDKLREKKPEIFNWKAYFRRLLGSIYDINIRSTRRKPSKRFEDASGIQHKKKVSILVAVDTSGSVSTKELQEFFNEIDYIHKAGARVTIVECDTRINSVIEYDGKNIPPINGRGGRMKVCASLCSNAMQKML